MQPRFYVPLREDRKGCGDARTPDQEACASSILTAHARIDESIRDAGRNEGDLAFLAAKAPNKDFAVIVDRSSGAIVDKVMLKPW